MNNGTIYNVLTYHLTDILLLVGMLIVPLIAQIMLSSTYSRYSKVHSSRGLTAAQVASIRTATAGRARNPPAAYAADTDAPTPTPRYTRRAAPTGCPSTNIPARKAAARNSSDDSSVRVNIVNTVSPQSEGERY